MCIVTLKLGEIASLNSFMIQSLTSTIMIPSILAVPVRENLIRAHYPLWSAQVLPAIRAAQLEDLIFGIEKA
jgi:hypothetical protein